MMSYKLLRVEEAADRLGLSPSTLTHWLWKFRKNPTSVPPHARIFSKSAKKMGRLTRITEEDLLRVIEALPVSFKTTYVGTVEARAARLREAKEHVAKATDLLRQVETGAAPRLKLAEVLITLLEDSGEDSVDSPLPAASTPTGNAGQPGHRKAESTGLSAAGNSSPPTKEPSPHRGRATGKKGGGR